MTDWISRNQPSLSEPDNNNNNNNNTEDQEDQENPIHITSHLYLRPVHNSQTLDKETVLRRIRHRKRINKVRNAVQGFLGWSVPVKKNKASVGQSKWVDDAFSAP